MGGLTCIIMFTERSRHRKLCRTASWDLGREFLTCSRVCWPAKPWLRRLWMRTHAGKVTQTLPTLMQDQYTRNKKRLTKTSVVTVTKMTVRSTYPQFLFPFSPDTNFVLANYKTEQCTKPPRLCRQGYACPHYHNSRDRRRNPRKFKYRWDGNSSDCKYSQIKKSTTHCDT